MRLAIRMAIGLVLGAVAVASAQPDTAKPEQEYLIASSEGIVAQNIDVSYSKRVLTKEPVFAAVHDATLDLVFFTHEEQAGLWVIDLRATPPRTTKLLDGVRGDFAVTWFDGNQLATSNDVTSFEVDFKAGTRTSKEPWSAAQRERKRKSSSATVEIPVGGTRPFGKTGWTMWSDKTSAGLRDPQRRTARIRNPSSWDRSRPAGIPYECDVARLDSTERHWIVANRVCKRLDKRGSCGGATKKRVLGWVVPGPVITPACTTK